MWVIPVGLALIGIVLAINGVRVAAEYERGVVFRLGRFAGLRGPGLYWLIPFGIERAAGSICAPAPSRRNSRKRLRATA